MAIGHTQKRGIVRGAGPTVRSHRARGLSRDRLFQTFIPPMSMFVSTASATSIETRSCPMRLPARNGNWSRLGNPDRFQPAAGTTDPSHTPLLLYSRGARTQTWQLLAATQNVVPTSTSAYRRCSANGMACSSIWMRFLRACIAHHRRIDRLNTVEPVTSLLPFGPSDRPSTDNSISKAFSAGK